MRLNLGCMEEEEGYYHIISLSMLRSFTRLRVCLVYRILINSYIAISIIHVAGHASSIDRTKFV